jgi:hypothetical protein
LLSDGRVFLCGGSDGENMLRDARIYDPFENSYTRAGDVPDLPTPRGLLACAPLKYGCVFVCGGTDGKTMLGDAFVIDTVLKEVARVPDLPQPRSRHGCCTLTDGRVFVCGGLHGGTHGNLADAYYYYQAGDTPAQSPARVLVEGDLVNAAPRHPPSSSTGTSGLHGGDVDDDKTPSLFDAGLKHEDAWLKRGGEQRGGDDKKSSGSPDSSSNSTVGGAGGVSSDSGGATLEEWLEEAEKLLETATDKNVRGRARAVRRDWDADVLRHRERFDKAMKKAAETRVRMTRELLIHSNLIDLVPEVQGDLADAVREMAKAMSPERDAFRHSHNAHNSLAAVAAGAAPKRRRPDAHYCPISSEVMSSPVMVSCGHTFDQSAITQWFLGQDTCPVCRTPVITTAMTPNHSLRNLIDEW